jgi:hypothetical protein
MKRINGAWLEGLSGPEKEKMKEEVLASQNLLDKLAKMLYNIQEKKRSSVLPDYDTPSWSHKQAHLNGECAALRKVLEIVTIKERDDNPTE